jgi:hypothetical protein
MSLAGLFDRVLSVAMTDGIIGCPHQEGIDYEGVSALRVLARTRALYGAVGQLDSRSLRALRRSEKQERGRQQDGAERQGGPTTTLANGTPDARRDHTCDQKPDRDAANHPIVGPACIAGDLVGEHTKQVKSRAPRQESA